MDLQTELLGELMNRVTELSLASSASLHYLERIAVALEKLARGNEPEEPNYVKPIDDFRVFNWESIGASIVQQDADGPTHLEHGGFIWTRRSPQNKFDAAIWFSRPNGKDADGNVKYLRLITFRPIKEADPLPRKAAEMAQAQPERRPAAAPNHATPTPAATSRPESRNGGAQKAAPAPEDLFDHPAPAAKPTKADDKMLLKERFMELATGRKFNLSSQAAQAVAQMAGIDINLQSADYTPAIPLVSYFAECKSYSMSFVESKAVLQKYDGDATNAIAEVRDNHKQ